MPSLVPGASAAPRWAQLIALVPGTPRRVTSLPSMINQGQDWGWGLGNTFCLFPVPLMFKNISQPVSQGWGVPGRGSGGAGGQGVG